MRGKAINAYVTFLHVGITPAYAGKSPEIATVIVQPQDHPRLCGEKPPNVFQLTNKIRITPAYAGKS